MTRKASHSREDIMSAALHVATRDGYQLMRREDIAVQAECSTSLVSAYLGTMPNLRRAVMRAAVTRGDKRVLAQGLAAGDKYAHEATHAAKRSALDALLV